MGGKRCRSFSLNPEIQRGMSEMKERLTCNSNSYLHRDTYLHRVYRLWTNGNTQRLSLYSFDRRPILSPDDSRARLSTLHPAKQKGFTRSMSYLLSYQRC